MDGGAWRATVYAVTKSQTRLKRLSTHVLLLYNGAKEDDCILSSFNEIKRIINTQKMSFLFPFPCNVPGSLWIFIFCLLMRPIGAETMSAFSIFVSQPQCTAPDSTQYISLEWMNVWVKISFLKNMRKPGFSPVASSRPLPDSISLNSWIYSHLNSILTVGILQWRCWLVSTFSLPICLYSCATDSFMDFCPHRMNGRS